MHYNRRERRRLARQLGILTTNETQAQATERRKRSRDAGDQIHRQFLADNEVRIREARADKEARMLESLTLTYGAERAKEIMENNLACEIARQEKRLKSKQAILKIVQNIVKQSKDAQDAQNSKTKVRHQKKAARKRQDELEKRNRIKIMRVSKSR